MVCITRICTGRGVGAQHGRTGLAVLDVEGVVHAARRMIGRHVEGLEVVPVGLDIGSLGDLEAEPDEHVLESLPRLGDHMGMAASRAGEHLREVDSLGCQLQQRARPRPARVVAGRAPSATAAVASLTRLPGGASSRRPWPSAPRPDLNVANGPRLPSNSASSARTSSAVEALATRSNASSLARFTSSIISTLSSTRRTTWARTPRR